MLYFVLLLLINLAGGALYGYALRRLTDPRMDPARVPRSVALAVPGSVLLCLAGFGLLLLLKVPFTFNLGPLGSAFGAVFIADLLRFDRLFEARLKRYPIRLRCSASPWHGAIAFGIGVALFQLILTTGMFTTPATQILLATAVGALIQAIEAVGALIQAIEAVVLPYFVTVKSKQERAYLQRGAWRMAVLRANLLFLCGAFIYACLWIPPSLVAAYESVLYAFIIVSTAGINIMLTSCRDSVFLTDAVVSPETTNSLLQENSSLPIRPPRIRPARFLPPMLLNRPLTPPRTFSGSATIAFDCPCTAFDGVATN